MKLFPFDSGARQGVVSGCAEVVLPALAEGSGAVAPGRLIRQCLIGADGEVSSDTGHFKACNWREHENAARAQRRVAIALVESDLTQADPLSAVRPTAHQVRGPFAVVP